jgi:hypothetical protein
MLRLLRFCILLVNRDERAGWGFGCALGQMD